MVARRSTAGHGLIHGTFVSYENGRQFYIDNQFLYPGKHFFNEKYADSSIVIPPKKMKLEKLQDKIRKQLFDTPSPDQLDFESPVTLEEDDRWWLNLQWFVFKRNWNKHIQLSKNH